METLIDRINRLDKYNATQKKTGTTQVDPRDQAIIDRHVAESEGQPDFMQKAARGMAELELEARRQQREYADKAPQQIYAPVREMLSNLGDRGKVLETLRQMTPEQRQEALKIAPGIAQQLGDDRGGADQRITGAISRGISHMVSQPAMELVGLGGTDEEIEYIRQLDAAASQEFNPALPSDPWYERGPLQAAEMAPWMATIVGGGGLGRAVATGAAKPIAAQMATRAGMGATTLKVAGRAGELAGITASAFPGQYAQEVDQLKAIGMEDDAKLRLLAGGTAAVVGLIEGLVPNPMAGPVSLTQGAAKAARQYLWEAAKRAPAEMSEEYFQGVTSGLGQHVAQYIASEKEMDFNGDGNPVKYNPVERKSIADAFALGWEQTKEAALPMAFLLGVPASIGASRAALQASSYRELQSPDPQLAPSQPPTPVETPASLQSELDALTGKASGSKDRKLPDGTVVPGKYSQLLTVDEQKRYKQLPGLIDEARKREETTPVELDANGQPLVDMGPAYTGPLDANGLPVQLTPQEQSRRLTRLQEILAKGFVSEEDAKQLGIVGDNRKDRKANASAELKQLEEAAQGGNEIPPTTPGQPTVPPQGTPPLPGSPGATTEVVQGRPWWDFGSGVPEGEIPAPPGLALFDRLTGRSAQQEPPPATSQQPSPPQAQQEPTKTPAPNWNSMAATAIELLNNQANAAQWSDEYLKARTDHVNNLARLATQGRIDAQTALAGLSKAPEPQPEAPSSIPQQSQTPPPIPGQKPPLPTQPAPQAPSGGDAGAAVAGAGKGIVEGLYQSMFDRLQQNRYPGIAKTPADDAVAAEHARQPFQTPEEIRQFVNDGSRPVPQEQPSPTELTQEEAAKLIQDRIAQRRAAQSQPENLSPIGDKTPTAADTTKVEQPKPTGDVVLGTGQGPFDVKGKLYREDSNARTPSERLRTRQEVDPSEGVVLVTKDQWGKPIEPETLKARQEFVDKATPGTEFGIKGFETSGPYRVQDDGQLLDTKTGRVMGDVQSRANQVKPGDITWTKEASVPQQPKGSDPDTQAEQVPPSPTPSTPPLQDATTDPATVDRASPKVRPGKVGDMLAAGEVVTTSSGRQTTPFPKIDTNSDRKAQNTVKRVDKWLHENAVEEARSRNDDFNLTQFSSEDPAKLPPASKDAMEEYLFGEQPKVVPKITKPLVSDSGTVPPAKATVDPDIETAVGKFKNRLGVEVTATPAEKLTSEQQEVLDFATSRGQKMAFVGVEKSDKKVPIGSFYREENVVLIREDLQGDKLWGTIGHEMAHSKGLDSILPADSAELKTMMDEYYQLASPEVRKRLMVNKPDHQREGRARMVQKFFEDKEFRDELKKTNPTMWDKLREAVLKFIGQWTPKDEAKRLLLEELRAAPKPEKIKGKKVSETSENPTARSGKSSELDSKPGSQPEGVESAAPKTGADIPASAKGFSDLPKVSRSIFETAMQNDTPDSLLEILHSGNKTMRAEFEARTGVELPKTVKGTKQVIEQWFKDGKKPETQPSADQVNVDSGAESKVKTGSAKLPWLNSSPDQETNWHGTKVSVAPSNRREEPYSGQVVRVLNRGEMVEVQPDGQDGTFRVDSARITLAEEKPTTAKQSEEPAAESIPEPTIPKFTRTTPDKGSTTRQDKSDRVEKARAEISGLERKRRDKQGEHDKLRSNATKKRAAARKEIAALNSRINVVQGEISSDFASDTLAKLEDELESPRSYDHYIAGMKAIHKLKASVAEDAARRGEMGRDAARSVVSKEEKEADRLDAELQGRAKDIAMSKGFTSGDAEQIALAASNGFTIFEDRSLADIVEVQGKRTRDSRVSQEIGKLKPSSPYGQKDLSNEQVEEFTKQYQEASLDDKGWLAKRGDIDKAVKESINANREASRKREEAERKEKEEEKAKQEQEALANARERAKKYFLDERISKALKKQKPKTKPVKLRQESGGGPVKIVEGKTTDGDQDGELYPNGLILHKTFEEDSKDFVLTHARSGSGFPFSAKKSDMQELIGLLDILGLDFNVDTDEKGALPSELTSRVKKINTAWDNGDYATLSEQDYATVKSLAEVAKTDIDADLILTADDLGANGIPPGLDKVFTDRGLRVVKGMAEEVPEFAYDPVFTVKDGMLLYRDGYEFNIDPTAFNLHPSELKEGQTVGINLEDLGINRATPQDVVAEVMKGTEIPRVTKTKGGAVSVGYVGARPTTLQQGENDNDWSVVGGTPKVQEIAVAALKKIRWRQPGQDGDPKTDIDVVPAEKESVVAKKESESDIVTPLDPVKRIENVIEQGRATGREPSKAMLEKLDDAKEETNSPMDSLPENGYIEGPKGGKLSKPQFEVGERVQVGNSQGVVESVNLRWSGTGPKGSAYKDSYKVRFDSGDLANAGSLSMDGNDMKKAASVEPVTETPKPIPAEVEFMEMSVGVNAPGVNKTIRVTAGDRTLLMERSKHDSEWSIREGEKYTGEVKGKNPVKTKSAILASGIVETKKAKEIAQRIIDGTFDKDADNRFVREDTQNIGLTNAGIAESMKGSLGGKRDSFAKLLREQGLVTDGRILMKVNDKDRDAILKGVGETFEGRSLSVVAQMMTDGQKALSRSANAMKPIGYRGGYLTPRTVVLQSQDGDSAIIDKSLHDTILKKYPNAVPYFLEDGKPISYAVDGDLVAIVMPMNMDKPDAKVKDLVAGKYDFEAEAAEAAKFPPPQAKSKLKKAAEQADSDKNLARQIKAASESLRNQSGDTDVLYQKVNVDPQVVVQATDLAIDAQDAGIESFDELVAFSVKTVGEQRTRDLGQYLAAAGGMLGLKGVRPVGDVIGMPGVTREQAMVLAKAAFPMLTDEQIEAGLDIQDATGFGRDQVGFAPFGTPVPGMSQSQRDKGDVKGWTQFISAARAIIGATSKADISTFIHELFHPMRKFLLDRSVPAESRSGITDEDIKALEDYAGAKDGKWTVESEEKAAKAWEQYWFEGKSPTTALRSLFEKIARWMQGVYRGVHQITGGQLPAEVRQLFDKIVQRGGISEQEMPQDDNLTSIKNEVMNDLRSQRGLPELADVAAQTQQEWIDTAESRMRAEPGIADRLVKAINASPRNLSNIEVAILQLHYRHVNNELASVSDRLFEAKDAGDTVEAVKAQREVDIVMNALAEIEDASKAAGREWGRAGVSRQIVLRKDFSLAGILRKARIANAGNALSAEQQAEMIELAKRVAELEGKLAKSEQEKLDLERQRNVERTLEEERKRPPVVRTTARKKASEAVSAFKQKFANIFSTKSSDTLLQTEDELMAEAAQEVVEAYVKAGVFSFGEFIANVQRDLGELPTRARVAFATAWEDAKMMGEIPTPDIDAGDVAGMTRLARRIQRSLVEAGITERDKVVDAVHESLQELVPSITRRETMDALSGYGQYSKLSQAENDKIIRDINGQLQQLAKLEDMRSGQAPSKTGGERRTPSDEERRLIKEVNEAKRRGGFIVTDPQAQLKTAMDAAKTAVRNRISDLEYEIQNRQRIVRTKTELTPDKELDSLRKRRDALLDVHKKLFPKPGATMEQRIAAANRAIDASIADLEERLKTGDVTPIGRKEPVSTPELEVKRARLKALQEQRDAIRALANPKMTPEERSDRAYKASLLKRIADYQERMVNSEFAPRPQRELRILTPEQLQIKKQLEEAKDHFFKKAAEYRLANMSPIERAWDYIKETSHLSRAIMTSFDLSAVFRQGGVGSMAHPVLAAKISRDMLKALMSSQAEFNIAEGIRNDPMYQFAMTAKLAITEEDGKITRQEEAFMGRWARHGIGKTGTKVNAISQKALAPVAASARAYTTFLNGMRFELFKYMVNNLGVNGQVTTDEAKVIAQYVNVATGRADLGKYNQAMANLNVLFFAPRYVASRFQFFALPFYLLPKKNVSLRVKKQIAMEYARYATGLGIFLGTAAALGSLLFDDDDDDKPTVELFDPRSTDFGKVKIGETRIDPMSGFSQVVTVVSQVLTGRKKGADGEIQHLRGEGHKWGSPTTWDVMASFARKKFAPIPSAVTNVIVGENVVGEEVTPLTATRDLFIPLSVSEVKETMQARGVPAGSAITILTLLGMGGGTYGPKTKFANGTEEERKTQLENDLKKMEWDSPDLPYRDLLNEEQYEQMMDRREERKQDLAYAATALPVHNKGQSKESFEKEVAAQQAAMETVVKAGWSEEFVRQLLRDYSKTRGNKEAVVDRIRRIKRIFSKTGQ